MEEEIRKEFVSYELAVRLKKIGFDEPCLAFYNGKHLDLGVWDWEYSAGEKRRDIGECPQAPTFSQAFKWFRKKYPFINFHVKQSSWEGEYSQFFDINVNDEIKNKTEGVGGLISYEEAELTCLEILLKIIEQK